MVRSVSLCLLCLRRRYTDVPPNDYRAIAYHLRTHVKILIFDCIYTNYVQHRADFGGEWGARNSTSDTYCPWESVVFSNLTVVCVTSLVSMLD